MKNHCGLLVFSFFIITADIILADVPTYSITNLGTLGGYQSIASAVNDSGQVVGHSQTYEYSYPHAFLYEGETMQDLGTLGAVHSSATDINEKGQILGRSAFADSPLYPQTCLYEGGTMHHLQILSGATAYAINNSGQIVGYTYFESFNDERAFLYTEGAIYDLGTLGGRNSWASDINDSGYVVGTARTLNRTYRAFLYDGETMHNLGSLGGDNSRALAINNLNQVVGFSNTSSGNVVRPFLYEGGKMHDLGTLDGLNTVANAINDLGQIVGTSNIELDDFHIISHAFLYDKGRMIDLNNLIPPNSGWIINDAYDINNFGQIVGFGTFAGEPHAFLMTPIPEPATLSLLALGAILAGRKRKSPYRPCQLN